MPVRRLGWIGAICHHLHLAELAKLPVCIPGKNQLSRDQ
jgi:hypothetical protein